MEKVAAPTLKLRKDDEKECPIFCPICRGVLDHKVTFKDYNRQTDIVTFVKQCMGCIQRSGVRGTTMPDKEMAMMDVKEFTFMWRHYDD